ncbi:chemotaxis protein CheW [Geomobilimonas luticola]|uniref:Chemotaxis protein CheW n=1 Tax=Geomobilimonas luticola TaxID=1114878 RepID=A0ABS5SFK7_9BACT|nr:chemotaxis protein CheW [Geomobilimonas luticola]MBT0654142.1 chemotaxis protein CheW [Geomobilimonas luticola]
MADNTNEMVLPQSGLAEDILAQFVGKAQQELDATATAVAAQQEEQLHHLVTFTLGREEYGVDIASVQEIIRATDITPVPGAPAHVRGVINLRGKIIPVVDLRSRFRMAAGTEAGAEASDARRIIVIELKGKRLGMQVDAVSQVIKVSSSVIEEMPEEAITLDQNYIKGVGKLEGRLIIILDLNRSLLLTDGN